MILQTDVALKSRGDDGEAWILFMLWMHKTNPNRCTPLLTVDLSGISTVNRNQIEQIIDFWNVTGVLRHIVIYPAIYTRSSESLIWETHKTLTEFQKLTKKDRIKSVYAFHYGKHNPHVHAFMASPIKSRLFINPQELQILYSIAENVFGLKIGARANLIEITKEIKSKRDPNEIELLRVRMKRVALMHRIIMEDIRKEHSLMKNFKPPK